MLSDIVTCLLLPLDIIAVDLPNSNRQRTLWRCCSRLPFVALFWLPFVNILNVGYLDTNISIRDGNRYTFRQIYLRKEKNKSGLTPPVFPLGLDLVKVIFIFIF